MDILQNLWHVSKLEYKINLTYVRRRTIPRGAFSFNQFGVPETIRTSDLLLRSSLRTVVARSSIILLGAFNAVN